LAKNPDLSRFDRRISTNVRPNAPSIPRKISQPPNPNIQLSDRQSFSEPNEADREHLIELTFVQNEMFEETDQRRKSTNQLQIRDSTAPNNVKLLLVEFETVDPVPVSKPSIPEPPQRSLLEEAVPSSIRNLRRDTIEEDFPTGAESKLSTRQSKPPLPKKEEAVRSRRSFTPIKELSTIVNEHKLKSTVNERNIYHNLCKRTEGESEFLKERSNLRYPSPVGLRRSLSSGKGKSGSLPKFKQTFFDKHSEFCVGMYRRIENSSSRIPKEQNYSPATTAHIGEGASGRSEYRGVQRSKERCGEARKHHHEAYEAYSRTQIQVTRTAHSFEGQTNVGCSPRILAREQFCNFCDNYMHKECFDKHFGRTTN
jgi:hypothetical protein